MMERLALLVTAASPGGLVEALNKEMESVLDDGWRVVGWSSNYDLTMGILIVEKGQP